MKIRVAVVGGGFAGLRAAVSLAQAGLQVTVIEGRAGLGGRARSFADPATGEVVDNGQHLLMGGYRRTLAFLEELGTRGRVLFQSHLRVSFVRPGGGVATLDCPAAPAPWHLILGMLRLKGIPVREKWRLRRVLADLRSSQSARHLVTEDRGETVSEWLERLGQGKRSREFFWDPLTVAALNERPEVACAVGLKRVLQTLMLEPWPNARLGMATVGLTELYAAQARQRIERGGGSVRLNQTVTGLELREGRFEGVRLADGSLLEADAVICAVPPSSLRSILPEEAADGRLREFLRCAQSSAIISVNLWLDRPVTEDLFVALVGCRFQWLFNKAAILRFAGVQAGYVSLIMSAAHDFIGCTHEELTRMAAEELRACFPGAAGFQVRRGQVVREREATVSLTVEAERSRPGNRTRVENLFLAGDWTATGLPATIESAVVSGELAAHALLQKVGRFESKWPAMRAP